MFLFPIVLIKSGRLEVEGMMDGMQREPSSTDMLFQLHFVLSEREKDESER